MDLRARARRRLPNFAFEYADGGAGADTGIARNWAALDAVEMVPRYGRVIEPPPADTTLFGKAYAAPIGIAPIGGPGTAYPGAETWLAKAAQAANVPYTLGLLSGMDIERAAEIAPDVLWLQLYRFSKNDHRIGLDLVRRAEEASVNVLVLTIDTPTRTTRPREVKSGIMNPFKLTTRLKLDAMRSPHWMRALIRSGIPKFTSLAPYMDPGVSIAEAAAFIRRESGGAFTWDEIARYRDKWKKPLVLKGVMHPEDAARAVELGIDGLFVTNHGGRQIDALPAPIDVLPAIAAAVGDKAELIYDSGVRSGVDAARAVALGADAAFAGKAFLWSLGALGERGPAHVIDVLIDDVSATLGQLGCRNVEELRSIAVRHPGVYISEDFAKR
jgi:L-lactate dehydrogenase (cytochrome)